jgi:hypothetical protein
MQKIRQMTLLTLLMGFVSASIFCEESSEEFLRPVKIAAVAVPAPDSEESPIGGIILDAAALELHLNEFTVLTIKSETEKEALKNQDFLLRAEYEIREDEISLDILCINLGNEEIIARTSWKGSLTLELDRNIQKVVQNDIVPALPEYFEVTRKETEKAAGNDEVWAVAALAAVSDESETGTSQSARPWRIGIGGALFIPLSSAATFSSLGYGVDITVGYAFNLGKVELAPALLTGFMWFVAQGAIAADSYVFPLGVELRVGTTSGQTILPYFRLAGGGAWYLLVPDGSSNVSKIIPFAEGGLGIDIVFTPTIGMYVDVGIRFLFEGSVTIINVAPGLGVALRF